MLLIPYMFSFFAFAFVFNFFVSINALCVSFHIANMHSAKLILVSLNLCIFLVFLKKILDFSKGVWGWGGEGVVVFIISNKESTQMSMEKYFNLYITIFLIFLILFFS